MPAYNGLSYTVSGQFANFTMDGRFFSVNESTYLDLNIDVKAAVAAGTISSGFAHWLASGWAEGRSISINANHFVESAYLARYPDVAAATAMGLESGFHHWVDNGVAEGRSMGGYATQQGAAGNDTLTAGAFIVRGYEGDDSIVSGGTAYGGTGNDTISGGSMSYGEEGDDKITFDTSGTAFGGLGNDTISGGDLIYGNQGNDSITGRLVSGSTLFGGQGNDTVSGGQDNDIIYGNMGDDILYGGLRVITRGIGISGNDYIHGGKGNDSIYGQFGNDTLLGGLGADQFGFDGDLARDSSGFAVQGATEIRDFKPDEGDRIVFPTGGTLFPGSFSAVVERTTDGSSGVVISLPGSFGSGTGTLTLTGIAKAQLQSEWFMFV